jgi:hypothetical protein
MWVQRARRDFSVGSKACFDRWGLRVCARARKAASVAKAREYFSSYVRPEGRTLQQPEALKRACEYPEGEPQVPRLRCAPVGMTILWRGAKYFSLKFLRAQQNCHPDRRSHGRAGPPKVMKNGSCSATTLPGSAISPLVIPTGAQRSGGTCGSAVLAWKCFFAGA